MKRPFLTLPVLILWALLLTGCAGWGRSCTGCNAEAFGADWVITKSDLQGNPYRCWKLTGVSVDNEAGSDGIQWKSPDGHMVHIAGHYDRVMVQSGNWPSAYAELGISEDICTKIQGRRYDPMTGTWRLLGAEVKVDPLPALPQLTPEQAEQLRALRLGN